MANVLLGDIIKKATETVFFDLLIEEKRTRKFKFWTWNKITIPTLQNGSKEKDFLISLDVLKYWNDIDKEIEE